MLGHIYYAVTEKVTREQFPLTKIIEKVLESESPTLLRYSMCSKAQDTLYGRTIFKVKNATMTAHSQVSLRMGRVKNLKNNV